MWQRIKAYFAQFDNGRFAGFTYPVYPREERKDESFEVWWAQHPHLSHTNAVWQYQQEGHIYDFRHDQHA